MNRKQKLAWLVIAMQLLALALATSMIDDAFGARTLTRGTLGVIVLLCIREFWVCVPTISRTRGMASGGVKA